MATEITTPRLWTPPARPLTHAVITSDSEMEALHPAWSDLLDRAERNEITQSPEWLLTWWRTFGPTQDRQLRLGVFYDGDRLVGVAPLLRRRHWYRGWLPFRRLEFLASGEPSADAICSNHLRVIAELGYDQRVAHLLVRAIAAGELGSWDEVVLPMIDEDTGLADRLVGEFRLAGFAAEAKITAGAPYIPLPTTWEAYLDSLTFSGRRNLERALKAFDKWSNNTTELQCISTAAELEQGKRILMDLHQQRWAAEGQAGVFRSPRFLAFHHAMMRTLVERGELELLILRAHGEPVAVLYNMIWAGKVYTYQTGRRTDMPVNTKPGTVIFGLAIRRAIEQGRREFDLLADEAFYKSQLTSYTRKLVQVRAARPSMVEMIRKLGVSWLARRRRKSKHELPA